MFNCSVIPSGGGKWSIKT